MKNTVNFTRDFLVYLLNTAGIPLAGQKHAKYIRLVKYYLVYSFVFLTSCQLFVVRNLKSFNDIAVSVAYINCGIFYNATTLVLHLKKKNVFFIFEFVKSGRLSANDKFRKFFLTYGLVYFGLYIVADLSPVLFFPFSEKQLGDATTLILPCKFPWSFDSYSKYALTLGLQISWLLPLSTPVLLNVMFAAYFVIEIRSQYDILCEMLAELKDSRGLEMYKRAAGEEVELLWLKGCVRHHQNILAFTKNFTSCYGWIFAANLIFSIANLSLFLVVLAMAADLANIIRGLFEIMVVMANLFLYCYIGQVLQDVNKQLKKTLYDIQYRKRSKNFNRTFMIVMDRTSSVLNLKAGYTYIASFELFYNILKMSFSFYNTLARMFK